MKAHQLLADKSKWCRGARGRNAAGESVGALAPDAVSWCANGAIEVCYGEGWQAPARKAREACEARYDTLGASRKGLSLSEVNDRFGHDVVSALLLELDI